MSEDAHKSYDDEYQKLVHYYRDNAVACQDYKKGDIAYIALNIKEVTCQACKDNYSISKNESYEERLSRFDNAFRRFEASTIELYQSLVRLFKK